MQIDWQAGAINNHPELQRYKILFISGNYSLILSRLNRNITELDVRQKGNKWTSIFANQLQLQLSAGRNDPAVELMHKEA